ncbi:MAG: hypothetical protein E6G92_02220 [Alphaproteobacteria bacterium]|nr:MAG: hypothetical protein E6G92_02220 [Alphaproteobacteria bacterium]
MARYYFHLRDGTEELLDDEGREFGDLEALEKAVLEGARDLIASELRSAGVVDLRHRIDAEDESGNIACTLPFKSAVTIIPQ